MRTESCTGCCACLIAGKAFCPLKEDEAHGILERILPADKKYYMQNGWDKSRYYYPVRFNVVKRMVGGLVDFAIGRMVRKTKTSAQVPAA